MKVNKVCVVGAGVMGSQLAQLLANNGYEVSMADIEDRFVQNGMNAIKGNLKKYFVAKHMGRPRYFLRIEFAHGKDRRLYHKGSMHLIFSKKLVFICNYYSVYSVV